MCLDVTVYRRQFFCRHYVQSTACRGPVAFQTLTSAKPVYYIYLNINQLDALNFIMSLFHASTCFEHCCAHRQEAKIVLYDLWYHHTYRWPSGAQVERGCIVQFWPPDDEHVCSKHVEA